MEKIKSKFNKILTAILVTIPLFATRMMVYAEGEEGEAQPTGLNASKLVIGTQNLVQAIIGWLTGISLTICGGYFIYYVYCLKTNDEDQLAYSMYQVEIMASRRNSIFNTAIKMISFIYVCLPPFYHKIIHTMILEFSKLLIRII